MIIVNFKQVEKIGSVILSKFRQREPTEVCELGDPILRVKELAQVGNINDSAGQNVAVVEKKYQATIWTKK